MDRKENIARRKEKDRLRRSKEILEAAQREILKRGYRGATIDMIAADAGITKPTIYQYFRTKDEIIFNLMEPIVRTIAENLKKIAEEIAANKYSNGKDIIHDVFDFYYSIFEKDPERFKLFTIFIQSGIISEMSPDSAGSLDKWGKVCFLEGQNICQRAIEQKFFKEVDAVMATDYAWGSFWGIVQIVQNKWQGEGISPHIKPMIKFSEALIIDSLLLQ